MTCQHDVSPMRTRIAKPYSTRTLRQRLRKLKLTYGDCLQVDAHQDMLEVTCHPHSFTPNLLIWKKLGKPRHALVITPSASTHSSKLIIIRHSRVVCDIHMATPHIQQELRLLAQSRLRYTVIINDDKQHPLIESLFAHNPILYRMMTPEAWPTQLSTQNTHNLTRSNRIRSHMLAAFFAVLFSPISYAVTPNYLIHLLHP